MNTHYVKKQAIDIAQQAVYTDLWGSSKKKSSSIVWFMLILITFPKFDIFAQRNLLLKLKILFKPEQLEFCTMILMQ